MWVAYMCTLLPLISLEVDFPAQLHWSETHRYFILNANGRHRSAQGFLPVPLSGTLATSSTPTGQTRAVAHVDQSTLSGADVGSVGH